MHGKHLPALFATGAFWALTAAAAHAADALTASPDGRTTLRIAVDGST